LGELDIVALEKSSGTICFVEVRSRNARAADFAQPQATVNRAKQRKVIRTARAYLKKKRAFGRPVRFDVIAVTFPAKDPGEPAIRHYPAAFDAGR
jgi:putative endonuclease